MAAIGQQQDSLDILEDKIEYLLKFVTIISELVLLVGLGYAGFKLAHKGATPDTLDQIWLVSQVLALDLSAPGLFAMAKRAKEQREEQRAAWAIKIAVILIIMSILTMAEGAVTSYIPNISQDVIRYVTLAMMIIRGGAAVGYSVFRRLHKTERQSITPAQSVPAQPIDYEEIARQLLPLVAQEVKNALQRSTPTAPEIATPIAPEDRLQSEVVSEESASVGAPEPLTEERNNITLMSDRRSAQTRSEKARKAASIIRRNPQISAPDLAKKAQISTSYARKLLVNQ